jgi:hypothetical protein
MIKTREQNTKGLDSETLYKDALYFSLVHRGVREERAKLEVERIVRRKKTETLDS